MARRTKAEAEATREALLDAAERIFHEKGVARTSLQDIAREAGLTRGAFYWHFRDKADLFRAMLQRVRLPFSSMLDDVVRESGPDNPLEVIRLACHRTLALVSQPRYRRVHAILIHRCEFFSDINPVEIQRQLSEEGFRDLLGEMRNAAEQGFVRPGLCPEAATLMLQCALEGMLYRWHRAPDAVSLEDAGGRLIDDLLDLIAA